MATDNTWRKPIILIRRPPHLPFSFAHRLNQHFTLLEPLPDAFSDLRLFLGPRAADIRLVICVGPSPLGADAISCLPSLECVLVTSSGVDLIDLAECRRRRISVANNGGAISEDVADYAVGLLIDVLRKISGSDRLVRAKNSPVISSGFPLGSKLGGKRVGIVGLGSIGSLVAKRLVAFGCKVSYTSRNKKSSAPYTFHDSIQSLAKESDAIILCCALTDQTRHIVNGEVMALLGERGAIINIGRGALIDEKEMVRFLMEGKIGGAGLDVFENEPQVPSELFGLENVVMSPHCAMLTPESLKAVADVVVGNVEAFFSNKPLLSIVPLD